MRITEIKINNRYRKYLGDIDSLAKSINELGLINPVTVDENGNLIAGMRRIEAVKKLGWKDIDVRVINIDKTVRGEYAENVFRDEFRPSELYAISQVLWPKVEAEARERQAHGQTAPGKTLVESFHKRSDTTRDQVASLVGTSGRNLEKVKKVVESGDEKLLKEMDDSGKVDRAYNKLRKKEQEKTLVKKEIEPASGEYDVIVIDPPWPMKKIERDVRPNQYGFDYKEMSISEITGLKIPAAKNAHIFLWTTQKYLPIGFQILNGWNVRYVCTFTWHKPGGFQPVGLPQYNCEFVLYGRMGTPEFYSTKAFPVCFDAPRGRHSEKPDEFYSMIKNATHGKRLNMFARKERDGFDSWGDEA